MASFTLSHHTYNCSLLPDILKQIFKKFNFEDKIRLAHVCHRWKDIIYEDIKWEEMKINVDIGLDLCTEVMIPHLIQRGVSKVKVDIRTHHKKGNSVKKIQVVSFLQNLLQNMTSLKAIDLSNLVLSERNMEQFLLDCDIMPNIRTVILCVNFLMPVEMFCHFASRFCNTEMIDVWTPGDYEPHMRKSCISDMHMQVMAQKLTKLQQLMISPSLLVTDVGIGNLTGCIPKAKDMTNTIAFHPQLEKLIISESNLTDQGLQYISQGFSNLIYLSLPESARITSVGIAHIAQMKSLRELHLHNCRGINDESVRKLAEAKSNITSLNLSGNYQIGDNALKYYGASELSLQELYLSCCNITDEGIHHLVKQGHTLKRLSIFGCDGVTDNSLRLIGEKCSSLQYLDLTPSNGITQQGIQQIKRRQKNLKVKELSIRQINALLLWILANSGE